MRYYAETSGGCYDDTRRYGPYYTSKEAQWAIEAEQAAAELFKDERAVVTGRIIKEA